MSGVGDGGNVVTSVGVWGCWEAEEGQTTEGGGRGAAMRGVSSGGGRHALSGEGVDVLGGLQWGEEATCDSNREGWVVGWTVGNRCTGRGRQTVAAGIMQVRQVVQRSGGGVGKEGFCQKDLMQTWFRLMWRSETSFGLPCT